ncbi:hypothetical protein [Nitrosospira sp. Nsp14]|nr:hypothetical protein [Nitrosospira sp. Nsp14]
MASTSTPLATEFDEGKTELLRMQNGGNHPTDPYTEKAFPPT